MGVAPESEKCASAKTLVSFAAVIREERCVTSDDPNNGCEGDYKDTCIKRTEIHPQRGLCNVWRHSRGALARNILHS